MGNSSGNMFKYKCLDCKIKKKFKTTDKYWNFVYEHERSEGHLKNTQALEQNVVFSDITINYEVKAQDISNNLEVTNEKIIEQSIRVFDDTLIIDENLINEDGIKCPVCFHLIVDPYESDPCGHLICHTCVAHITKNCPLCRGQVNEYKKNNFIRRRNENLKVKCLHYIDGCTETFSLKDADSHLKKCKYMITKCDFGCDEYIYRMNMDKHYEDCTHRLIDCPNCREYIKFNNFQEHLDHICPERKVYCPNDCGMVIQHKMIDQHRANDCARTLINCKYHEICNIRLERQQMQEHENDSNLHIKIALGIIQDLRGKNSPYYG
jgi:hypothetical protein